MMSSQKEGKLAAPSLEDLIKDELAAFMSRSGGDVSGALVARRDGLPVAYIMPTGDPKLVAAMWALARGALVRFGEELKLGELKHAIVQYEDRLVLIKAIKGLCLVALASPNANVGLLLLELDRLTDRLAELI